MTRCSNNTVEYKTVIARLEPALQIPIASLTNYNGSELAVGQLRGEFNVKKTELVPYNKKTATIYTIWGS